MSEEACPGCGTELPGSARFCPECGRRVARTPDEPQAKAVTAATRVGPPARGHRGGSEHVEVDTPAVEGRGGKVDDRAPVLPLEAGTVVGDRYELRGVLGKGGMGAVMSAWDRLVKEEVAVKFMHPFFRQGEETSKRFLREGRLARRLNHPRIVRTMNVESHGGLTVIVMERLHGSTLRDVVREHGLPLPAGFVAGLVDQVLEALEAAHGAGVIHRDIKPQNIWVESVEPPLIKVMDFGLAKDSAPIDGDVTVVPRLLGTPSYMAPEQGRLGSQVDHRADLHSLAVVAHEVLTGSLPGAQVDPSVPAELAPVLARALEARPQDRFPDAKSMRSAWRDAVRRIDHPPDESPGRPLAPHRTGAPPPRSEFRSAPPPHEEPVVRGSLRLWANRTHARATEIALVGLVLLVLAATAWLARDEPARRPQDVGASRGLGPEGGASAQAIEAEADLRWLRVRESRSLAAVEGFLATRPGGAAAREAERLRADLEREVHADPGLRALHEAARGPLEGLAAFAAAAPPALAERARTELAALGDVRVSELQARARTAVARGDAAAAESALADARQIAALTGGRVPALDALTREVASLREGRAPPGASGASGAASASTAGVRAHAEAGDLGKALDAARAWATASPSAREARLWLAGLRHQVAGETAPALAELRALAAGTDSPAEVARVLLREIEPPPFRPMVGVGCWACGFPAREDAYQCPRCLWPLARITEVVATDGSSLDTIAWNGARVESVDSQSLVTPRMEIDRGQRGARVRPSEMDWLRARHVVESEGGLVRRVTTTTGGAASRVALTSLPGSPWRRVAPVDVLLGRDVDALRIAQLSTLTPYLPWSRVSAFHAEHDERGWLTSLRDVASGRAFDVRFDGAGRLLELSARDGSLVRRIERTAGRLRGETLRVTWDGDVISRSVTHEADASGRVRKSSVDLPGSRVVARAD